VRGGGVVESDGIGVDGGRGGAKESLLLRATSEE